MALAFERQLFVICRGVAFRTFASRWPLLVIRELLRGWQVKLRGFW